LSVFDVGLLEIALFVKVSLRGYPYFAVLVKINSQSLEFPALWCTLHFVPYRALFMNHLFMGLRKQDLFGNDNQRMKPEYLLTDLSKAE
jgi:hypothetical protein